MTELRLSIIGGGLAGSEAAWQAAQRGVAVTLFEMRPGRTTPAHCTDRLAELVCSNSLGSDLPDRAPGLLKAELRRAGSLILEAADTTRVPAGSALAVDRDRFAERVTAIVAALPGDISPHCNAPCALSRSLSWAPAGKRQAAMTPRRSGRPCAGWNGAIKRSSTCATSSNSQPAKLPKRWMLPQGR